MKFPDWAMKHVGKVSETAAAAVKVIAPAAKSKFRDPWYSDDERKAEINARRAGGSWLGLRSRGWLK